MGLGFVIPLVALQVTLYTENLYFSYVPLIPLILTVAVWGVRRGMVAVSNRVLVLLLLIAVVSVRIHGAPWLSFGSLFMDAPTVLLIAVLPHLAGRLDFSRLATSRMFCYNVLVALVVVKIYLAMGRMYPKMSFLKLGVSYGAAGAYRHIASFTYILTWVITIGAVELAARLLHSMAGKSRPAHNG